MELQALTYRILFGEDPITLPDPNLPENEPRIEAERKKVKEDLQRFWNGPGKPLMERWQTKLRVGVHALLISEDKCNCALSIQKRELLSILKMLSEAETFLTKE